jgi:monofunctional biosynthetic peptidoglycan transglycosylase
MPPDDDARPPDALPHRSEAPSHRSEAPSWRGWARLAAAVGVGAPTAYLGLCTLLLVAYAVVDPPTTGVQMQRRVEAWLADGDAPPYVKRYAPVPRAALDADLALAVVSAEDTRFYQHAGIDWKAVREAIEDNRERGRVWRGGSTITQQLVKNLFQTTHSSFVRKGFEVPLTYAAELVLSKDRILTLYLNVIEWDRGVYGAEAAAQHHYGQPAARLTRAQAAALAACIPDPRRRAPAAMGSYARTIRQRMAIVEREGLAPAW